VPSVYPDGVNTSPPSTLAFAEAVDRVREGGGRVTKARRDLLEDLYGLGGRITAEELAERHDDIDLATVYRSLAHFEQVGVIEHVHLGHGPASYRWAGARTIAAVCDGCGVVIDIPAEELGPLAERLEDEYGLRLSLGHFALSVRCPHC
jgi:Fur family transcriptional regulator, ferric uptake regulator